MASATIELYGNFNLEAPVWARRRFEDAAYVKDLCFMRTQSSVLDDANSTCLIRIIGDKGFLYRDVQPEHFGYTVLDDIASRLSGLGHSGIQVLQSMLWLPA